MFRENRKISSEETERHRGKSANETAADAFGWKKKVRKRIKGVCLFMLIFIFVPLMAKLAWMQSVEHEKYVKYAKGQHNGNNTIPAIRGAITDRKYVVLANSISLPTVQANPSIVKDKERASLLLSQILECPQDIIRAKLSIPGTFTYIQRKVSDDKAEKIKKLKDAGELYGVDVVPEPTGKRFYPKGNLGAHIIGITGLDDQGLDGIEAVMDPYLAGKPGSIRSEISRDNVTIPGGISAITPAEPGKNIVLTIDESVQYIVENSLRKAVKAYGAESGSVLVMDAKTGEILALANMPDYKSTDPKSKEYMMLTRNKCVTDAYEPGSTFKVVLAAAALDSGKVKINDQIPCGDIVMVDGWDLHNANDGFGGNATETITDIIAYSFNTGSVHIGLRMGLKIYYGYIKAFGFGDVTGIELPGETEGILPAMEDIKKIDLATMSYGQSISVTPLQIVSAVQGTINNGEQMRPTIIRQILDQDGNIIKDFKPEIKSRPINSETSFLMNKIMRNVIENGTGKHAKIPGYLAGGKSGTANICENGVYQKGMYNASFVGYAPAEDPKFVMIVKIEKPKGTIWGGSVAGPIFSEIGREILWALGIPPSFPNEINKMAGEQQEKTN